MFLVLFLLVQFSSVLFSLSVVSDSFQHHGLQHARPPCPAPTPGVYSNSCPLSQWCHPSIPYLSLLFFGTLHSNAYVSFSPMPFTSLIFIAVCKPFSENHFAFLHFLFLGMVLISASCIMSWTSIHTSSGNLSIRSIPLNLFVTSTV